MYDAAAEALKESPAERNEDAGTIRVPITLLLSLMAHEWTQIFLYFSPLVLAPGDEKREGKESETESEFVDIKGIYCSFPQLHVS